MDFFSLYSNGKRCALKWLILCIIVSCADTEIYFRRLLPKRKVIWQMNHTAMNNSIWTTNSQSLSDFEFSHFCRYFPFLFDSCGHILLIPLTADLKNGQFLLQCFLTPLYMLQSYPKALSNERGNPTRGRFSRIRARNWLRCFCFDYKTISSHFLIYTSLFIKNLKKFFHSAFINKY